MQVCRLVGAWGSLGIFDLESDPADRRLLIMAQVISFSPSLPKPDLGQTYELLLST